MPQIKIIVDFFTTAVLPEVIGANVIGIPSGLAFLSKTLFSYVNRLPLDPILIILRLGNQVIKVSTKSSM